MKIEEVEDKLNGCYEYLNIKKFSKIVSPESSEASFFFIKSGYLKQYYNICKKNHVFRLLQKGDFCGSIAILYGDLNHYEFIETVSDVKLLKFNYTEAIKVIDSNLELSIYFRKILEYLLYYQEKRIIKFLSLSPKDRYKNLHSI
ncbi:MAG: cyclic nucleotide-binding domain-containing protein [Leptospiraceae bacterium]|nr:cyclic nucleotide-binding domain-containing protein [Leptospiraceae bacterium]MCZ8346510.1 cyclic nucleotide-binding domain-containing protein [Leptospiraceae bacterium]